MVAAHFPDFSRNLENWVILQFSDISGATLSLGKAWVGRFNALPPLSKHFFGHPFSPEQSPATCHLTGRVVLSDSWFPHLSHLGSLEWAPSASEAKLKGVWKVCSVHLWMMSQRAEMWCCTWEQRKTQRTPEVWRRMFPHLLGLAFKRRCSTAAERLPATKAQWIAARQESSTPHDAAYPLCSKGFNLFYWRTMQYNRLQTRIAEVECNWKWI